MFFFQGLSQDLLYALWTLIKILCVILPLVLFVLYLTFAERKIIGYMQSRLGPNTVGPFGLLQPFADALKMFTKEIIVPANSSKYLFFIAPILSIAPSIAAWAVIPFNFGLVISNIDLGLLYVYVLGSVAVYAVVLAGWASNSRYALLGSMRAAAQTISYEIPMGLCIVGVALGASSLNLTDIVNKQIGGFFHWYWLPMLPLLVVFWLCALVETNRAPFDVAEGETEIVAGYHVEYSGITFGLFYLSEYMHMILLSFLTSILFFGGWLPPFGKSVALSGAFSFVPGIFWLLLKVSLFLFLFIWVRATLPRYRFDQIMRIGWSLLIPISVIWIVVIAIFVYFGFL